MKKMHISLMLFILFGFVFNNIALPWDNNVTHKDLSQFAAENSVLSKGKGDYLKNLGFEKGLDEIFKWSGTEQKIKKWLREGAFREDEGNNWQGFTGAARYTNHFHNPLKPWSAAGLTDLQNGESTVLWAQDSNKQSTSVGGDWSWKTIRDYFYYALTSKTDNERQANFAQTFRGLGHQMHLIQDMSVPAHVRNDAHPEDSLLEFNRFTEDYYFETWAKKYYPRINSFASSPAFPNVDLNISRNGLAPISQFIDTEQYNENIVPSKSLNWGLSEYTNSNFASTDTIFTENFNTSDRHYFPDPRYVDQNQCYDQYEETYGFENKKRTYWRKKCLGEPIDHFVTVGSLFKYLPTWDLQRWEIKLDESTHNDYASKLIPRAVGYSAGLLNYFFRGDIDMIPDDATGSGYVIENNSDEDMNGNFELFYDKTTGERIKIIVPELNAPVTISKKSSGNNKSPNITFSAPTDAKEPGKYILVFRGKMGNEEGAVFGKRVNAGASVTGRLAQADRSSDGKMIFLRVYTESGLISSSFSITNSGLIAVRFNLSNHDEFAVAVAPNKIYKFTIDEFNKTINYRGLVAEYSVTETDEFVPFCEEIVDDCEGLIGVPGEYKVVDGQRIHTEDAIIIQDFFYDVGSIKSFGSFHEGHFSQLYVRNYCGDIHMWDFDEAFGTITDVGRRGIYYDAKLINIPFANCVGGSEPQSCSDWGIHCEYHGLDEMTETYKPIAIFNTSEFSYAHYRAPYGYYPLSGCDYMSDLISPVTLPCSAEQVKTMLRKDGGRSLYYRDAKLGQYGNWYSYSSGVGTMEGRYLISNDNPTGENIGWDDNGNIVKVNYDNGQIIINKLKYIGGSFSGFFDVSLKFSD